MKTVFVRLISLVAVICVASAGACFAETSAASPDPFAGNPDYKLKRIVIVSRHNIRAPLESGIAVLNNITPHEWVKWTSNPGELSLRGGIAEAIFGQYFKQALEKCGFIPQNWEPDEKEVRFRANSFQRTIATARFFAAGFLPCAEIKVEHKEPIGEADSDIHPELHFCNEEYSKKAAEDIAEYMGVKEFTEIYDKLRDGLNVLEKVLDYKDSKQAAETGSEHIPTDQLDILVTDKDHNVAAITGGLKLAVSAADALGLQYLEGAGDDNTFFGHRLTDKEISDLNSICDTFTQALYGTPSIAVNAVHPLLSYLKDELQNKDRRFSFTCAHDSNIVAITSALGIKPYTLNNTIGSSISPISCKIVFCVYEGPDGKECVKVFMMYPSNDHIRKRTELSVSVPPMITELSFDGLEKNKNGYYALEDLIKRFDEAIDAYWELPGNSKDESSVEAA